MCNTFLPFFLNNAPAISSRSKGKGSKALSKPAIPASPARSKKKPSGAEADKVKKREAMLRARLAAAEGSEEDSDEDEEGAGVGDAPSLLFGLAAAAAVANEDSGGNGEEGGNAADLTESAPAHEESYGADDFEDDDFEDDDEEDEEDDEEDDDSSSNGDGGSSANEEAEDGGGGGGGGEGYARLDPEVAAAMAAMHDENQAVAQGEYGGNGERSPSARAASNRGGEHPGASRMERPKTGRVNFQRAKQTARNAKMSKSSRRAKELANLVELDLVTINLFDMPPMTEYEMYIRSYGGSNSAQTGSQTGIEGADQEIQTERIEMRTKWTQEPPNDLLGCGRDEDEADEEQEHQDEETARQLKRQDAARLGEFIGRAGMVISAILEENLSLYSVKQTKSTTGLTCSESVARLASTIPLFAGRSVTHVTFSTAQPSLILAVLSPAPALKSSDPLRSKGFVCVWNLNQPSIPQKILVCESQPTCAAFGPNKASLAVAGTADGTCVLWDLREPASLHRTEQVGGVDYLLRHPTYSTDGIPAAQNHHAPVVSLAAIKAGSAGSTAKSASASQSAAFQVATLDAGGVLKTWTVVELKSSDPTSLSQELGLLPGGQVKLTSSATLQLGVSSRVPADMLQTFCFALFPDTPNKLIVGTNQGNALHAMRFGDRAAPRAYAAPHESSDITSLHFSPFAPEYFLAACSSGHVALYAVDAAEPVDKWRISDERSGFTTVQWVQWSYQRPGVFFALDSAGILHIWDLLESINGPVVSESVQSRPIGEDDEPPPNPRAVAITSIALSSAEKNSTLVVAYGSGGLHAHTLSERFTQVEEGELESLMSFLEDTL